MAMPTLGRFLFLTSWSEIIQTYRPRIAITIAIFGISASSIFWFFARSWIGLGTIEAISGVLWTGLDLCMILYFQDFVKGRARAITGFYIFCSQAVTLIGAGIGHFIMPYASSLQSLFEVSAIMRALFTIVLLAVVFQRSSRAPAPATNLG
jgi:MFS family permease